MLIRASVLIYAAQYECPFLLYCTCISCSTVFLLPTLQQVSTHRWPCSELIYYCSLFALTEGNKKENKHNYGYCPFHK